MDVIPGTCTDVGTEKEKPRGNFNSKWNVEFSRYRY